MSFAYLHSLRVLMLYGMTVMSIQSGATLPPPVLEDLQGLRARLVAVLPTVSS